MVYQPQVAEWAAQKHMVAYAAVGVESPGAQKPALGSIKVEADTKVALDSRLVSFSDLAVTESNFPSLSKDQTRDVVAEVVKAVPTEERVIALDRVLAAVDKSQILPKNVEGVKADPPPIFFSQTPAVLVNIDGDPIWSPIKDNDLKYAVNTNWDLFQHEPTKTFYLLDNGSWLTTTDLKGAWTAAGKLPESFSKLPADENWKETKAAVPGKKLAAGKLPKVFVSLVPAELILLTGAPSYVLVQGTQNLLWVSNTESDVFRMGKTGPVYFLVSGRWFSAPDFTGPWTFATPSMPEVFQNIPLEHPRSRVLAAVPGTQQAAEAVLLAQVPQTARVNKKTMKAPDVAYQGDPKFQPIEKTTLEYAVNTDKQIIKFGDLYYMCFQGVWFMSKSATGPWEVATSIPKEIYGIPSSSPAHNVTYVTVEDDDDEWVTFAAVAAYTGVMVAWGCAVWGTGWYHPPYWGWGGYYPFYYPHYPSYGYGAWYNPWNGAYGRTAVAYGPYGGAGVSARYNPSTGTYSRGAAAWGPYGARGAGQAYNPRTGTYAQTRQGSNVYGSWGSTSVQRGDQWAQTSRVTNNRTGTTTRVTQGSGGGEAISRNTPGPGGSTVARTGSGDVYAGRDGNVYKKSGDSWQKSDGSGGWSDVNRPETGVGSGTQAGTQQARDRAATGGGSTAPPPDNDRPRGAGWRRREQHGPRDRRPAQPRRAGALRRVAAHERLRRVAAQRRRQHAPDHQLPAERRRHEPRRRRAAEIGEGRGWTAGRPRGPTEVMMSFFVSALSENPELAIFLTLAVGFVIGRIRIGSFSLGNVVGTLLAGVVIGQLNIKVDPLVKVVFFDLFLFATGYKVGPQFFRGLKKNAGPQVALTVVLCVTSLVTTVTAAKIMGYDSGTAAGLMAGAFTESTVIGTAGQTIERLDLPAEEKQRQLNNIPVAYAVSYLVGTGFVVWFLSSLAPRLLKVNLKEESRKLEASMAGGNRPTPAAVRCTASGICGRSESETPRRRGTAPWRSSSDRLLPNGCSWSASARATRSSAPPPKRCCGPETSRSSAPGAT